MNKKNKAIAFELQKQKGDLDHELAMLHCSDLGIEYTTNLNGSIDLYVDTFPNKTMVAGYNKGTDWNTIYQDLLIIGNYIKAQKLK